MRYIRSSMAAASALTIGMFLAPVSGSAQSGVPAPKSDFGDPVITLVAHGGGGGWAGGGGGGHAMSGGPSGHAGAMMQGGRTRGFAESRSNGPGFTEGRGGRFEPGDRGHYAEGRERADRFDRRDGRFAERGDRDFDRSHHRHGHFVNGVWILDYGPDYYAYDYDGGNCWWLQRRAVATGNPYWWDRYNDCVGYD